MIGYLTTDDFEPGKTPDPDTWFVPADFDNDAARVGQADILDGIDIASMFIRFESGQSNTVSIQHCPFMPVMFSLRYLVHGTSWHQREKSSVYSESRPASRWHSRRP